MSGRRLPGVRAIGAPAARGAAAVASCGANDIATVIATPASYKAPGIARSNRRGLASALAEPTHTSNVASCKPP